LHRQRWALRSKRCLGELATVGDNNALGGGARAGANGLHGAEDVVTSGELTEDNVLAVEPRGVSSADEELGSVGVGASVSHGEASKASVLAGLASKGLVLELVAVDGLATSAVAAGEVTTLAHELGDHTVEATALVVEGLAGGAGALLAGAESAEVLSGLGDGVGVELHLETAGRGAADGDVEEDNRVGHGANLRRKS